jgi:hypothetical protein
LRHYIEVLIKRGADGTKKGTLAAIGIDAPSTALDIVRTRWNDIVSSRRFDNADVRETLVVLRQMCCSSCGMTSAGLSATTTTTTTTRGGERHLKRCGSCPARGSGAHYCSKACQRADWVARHRGECAEARRAWQAAGTEA